jgi:hypothetical protein
MCQIILYEEEFKKTNWQEKIKGNWFLSKQWQQHQKGL